MGQSEKRTLPTQDDIVDNLYTDFEIEPYTVKRNGVVQSCLTEINAINLINTYCSSLLRSKFICLVPIWTLDELDDSEKKFFRVLYIFFTYYLFLIIHKQCLAIV